MWLPKEKQDHFRKEFFNVWDRNFPTRNSELKWTKVSIHKLNAYKDFIDLFRSLPFLDFRCVLLDTHAIDYKKYHEGDRELGFYKFLFFFLSRNIEKDYIYRERRNYYQIFHDQRRMGDNVETGRLTDLKKVLNHRLAKTCVDLSSPQVRNIEAVDSKESPEVQLTDVLTGAIGYSWEGYQTSRAKLELIKHTEDNFGLKLEQSTPFLTEKINIWYFQLS